MNLLTLTSQVTKALRNSISCSENEAVEYATIVDREVGCVGGRLEVMSII